MTPPTLDDILKRMHELQSELEDEIERLLNEKRERFQYTLEQGKVRFEQSMKNIQLKYKIGLWSYLSTARLGHILSAPFIYSVFIPLLALDLSVSVYQHICFRLYKIPRVKRSDYFLFDHKHLAYLNIIEKFNCLYCSYANGLIEYVREVSARTEQYWCPIKHARRTPDPHRLVERFVDYGDVDEYRSRLSELQEEIASLDKENQDNR